MHCSQRSYLRAQLGMTIQIGRMELIISITAGGETVAVFLGSLETA